MAGIPVSEISTSTFSQDENIHQMEAILLLANIRILTRRTMPCYVANVQRPRGIRMEGTMKTDLMKQLKTGAVKRGCQKEGK